MKYDNVKAAYININKYIEDDKPAGKSSGLLGRMSGSDKKKDQQGKEPIERMAKLVQRIRKARREVRNGTTSTTN